MEGHWARFRGPQTLAASVFRRGRQRGLSSSGGKTLIGSVADTKEQIDF